MSAGEIDLPKLVPNEPRAPRPVHNSRGDRSSAWNRLGLKTLAATACRLCESMSDMGFFASNHGRGPDTVLGEASITFSSLRFSELSQSICGSPLLRLSGKSGSKMPSTAILQEVQRLCAVSDRLDSLAERNPLISEALLTISGSVRNTATLLEVLVATKLSPRSGLDPAN
jgi:hypothetical protein